MGAVMVVTKRVPVGVSTRRNSLRVVGRFGITCRPFDAEDRSEGRVVEGEMVGVGLDRDQVGRSSFAGCCSGSLDHACGYVGSYHQALVVTGYVEREVGGAHRKVEDRRVAGHISRAASESVHFLVEVASEQWERSVHHDRFVEPARGARVDARYGPLREAAVAHVGPWATATRSS